MIPVQFPESNGTLARDQGEYEREPFDHRLQRKKLKPPSGRRERRLSALASTGSGAKLVMFGCAPSRDFEDWKQAIRDRSGEPHG